MISLVLAAALFAAGEPAAADAVKPAQAAVKAEKSKADKDGMVCKREAVLGSRLKQRVCMTQSEWDERARQDRADLDRAQSLKPLSGN